MEKKIYEKKSEKVIDFLIGFFAIPWGIGLLVVLLGYLMPGFNRSNYSYGLSSLMLRLFYFGVCLSVAIYFGRKRKYILMGLLFALVVVPLVLLGTCLLIWAGSSIYGTLFRR